MCGAHVSASANENVIILRLRSCRAKGSAGRPVCQWEVLLLPCSTWPLVYVH